MADSQGSTTLRAPHPPLRNLLPRRSEIRPPSLCHREVRSHRRTVHPPRTHDHTRYTDPWIFPVPSLRAIFPARVHAHSLYKTFHTGTPKRTKCSASCHASLKILMSGIVTSADKKGQKSDQETKPPKTKEAVRARTGVDGCAL